MSLINKFLLYKNLGETPLECVERLRAREGEAFAGVPLTYAGRLDPMAEGLLLVLAGEECKQKEKYLGLNKEYECEILWGIETDTYDILGIVKSAKSKVRKRGSDSEDFSLSTFNLILTSFLGKRVQEYPAYSSKTVGGKQLHELARQNELPEDMPAKEVEVYKLESFESYKVAGSELLELILKRIDLVRGDFRQEEIKQSWKNALEGTSSDFLITKIKVSCSSGTYIRSLAHEAGQKLGCGALALSIKRTKIGGFSLGS